MRIKTRIVRAATELFLQQPHLSARTVATVIGCAPGTAHKVRLIADACNLRLEEISELDDQALTFRLFGGKKPIATEVPEPDWDDIHRKRQEPDATLTEIWIDWNKLNPTGWGYSHFARKYRAWLKKQELTMRQVHRAGEKIFVDFAGGTLPIRQADGTTRDAQMFVAVLGASNYTFATLVWSQKIPDWIECSNRMVAFFGGVSKYIVPDNLKSAVIRAGLSRLILNETYLAWALHHGTVILPAKSRSPRWKAKAEVGVQITQRKILWRMRHETWHSIEEANAALQMLLAELNDRPFKKLKGCRSERFAQIDKPALHSLPSSPFEYFELIVDRLVPNDYHVEFDHHHYSVPHALVGSRVDLRVTANTIEILHGGRRKCAHPRSFVVDAHSTLTEHMPANHRYAQQGEPAELLKWAEEIGPATLGLIAFWLSPGSAFHRGLIASRGLRQESELEEIGRIESACAHAEKVHSKKTLSSIRSILRHRLDLRAAESSGSPSATGTAHENIRGGDYYDKKEAA